MTQITEDYVSFGTAKFLKYKGFNVACDYLYVDGKLVRASGFAYNWNDGETLFAEYENECSAPTLQMAMKWLRKVHNLVIEPYRTACGYLYTISNIPYGSTKYNNGDAYNGDDENSGQWTTWEKACEDGIKYCLENLI